MKVEIKTRKARRDGWHGGKRQHIDLFSERCHLAEISLTPLMSEKERLELAHIFKAAPQMYNVLQRIAENGWHDDLPTSIQQEILTALAVADNK